jgi:hypothetical protein
MSWIDKDKDSGERHRRTVMVSNMYWEWNGMEQNEMDGCFMMELPSLIHYICLKKISSKLDQTATSLQRVGIMD